MSTTTLPMPVPETALQLRSLVKSSGQLVLSLEEVPVPTPGPGEVLVRVDASPINPSDQGLLLASADFTSAVWTGTPERPVVSAPLSAAAMKSLAGRVDESMPVGNEGAGQVVAAGSSAASQALLGRTVAMLGGAMYAQYRCVPVEQCLPLPEGATAADGASCFVNPLTALGMVETMRREGHTALVHTAAASNLGQMLNRICLKDGVALVNIVRKSEQAALLKAAGAVHVVDSSAPSFIADLTDALVATGATIAFDATGGGKLGGQILGAMEAALGRTAKVYSRYGSTTHKQVYLYGGLDTGPTEFVRNFGMSWGMGGWLLFPFLQKVGPHAAAALKQRVADELKTTFASHYAQHITLAQVLQKDTLLAYSQRATASKYLIEPSRGV